MRHSIPDLPPGWAWAPLGDLGDFINGRAFKPTDWKDKGRLIIRIQNLTGSTNERHYFDGPIEEKHIVHSGDVLVSWSATLDAFVWSGPESILNQHIFKVRPFVDKMFLYYLIKSSILKLKGQVHGTGMQHITKGRFDSTPVPLPPLPEQRRIVIKIEKLLQELRTANRSLQEVPALAKRFRQSVLTKAFRGELTERDPKDEPAELVLGRIEQRKKAEWESESKRQHSSNNEKPRFSAIREELGKIPDGWAWTTLSRLAEVKGGVAKGRRFPGRRTVKAPYLRVANVQSGYLDLTTVKEIDVLPEEVDEYQLRSGDILFTEGGDRDKLGRGTVWHNEVPKCVHQNHIFRARLKTKDVLPEYISLISQSLFGRDYFSSVASQTVNLASINITNLRSFPIPLAPTGEQVRVVAKIGQLLALADRVKESAEAGVNSTETLAHSILARAFRGELVPQDPNDEPASILLERIRAQRAAMGKKKVRRKLEEFASPAAITPKV